MHFWAQISLKNWSFIIVSIRQGKNARNAKKLKIHSIKYLLIGLELSTEWVDAFHSISGHKVRQIFGPVSNLIM